MSQVKVSSIVDTSGGNTVTINGMTPTAQSLQGFRNRIINGDMRIDQRNAGTQSRGVADAGQLYGIDRWYSQKEGGSNCAFSVQKSSDVPSGQGFLNSILFTITSTDGVIGATEYNMIGQNIEGVNIADLMWGTANAKTITLSFWVKSSLTGTFAVVVGLQGTNVYPASYTISSANTWEYKTITVAGPTSGSFPTDNTAALHLRFDLGVGSNYSSTLNTWQAGGNYFGGASAVKLAATNGATFYITGVQLEAGSVATPFERRPYGTELALCQRYYWKSQAANSYSAFGSGTTDSATQASVYIKFPVTMRTTPTFAYSGSLIIYSAATSYGITATVANYASYDQALWQITCSGGGMTAGRGTVVLTNNDNNAYLTYTAEL